MSGLVEIAEVMLSASQRRLDVVSHNVANTATPGYKRSVGFEDVMAALAGHSSLTARLSQTPQFSTYTDFSQGSLGETGGALDLAISSAGFFAVRGGDTTYLTREGQFQIAPDGRVTNPQGLVLQTADQQDLVLGSDQVEILEDGTVLDAGLPVSRIGVFEPLDALALAAIGGSLFQAGDQGLRESLAPLVRQGMLESANVDMASEMVEMMAALRQAEIGARVIQVYDSLMGQVFSTFGGGSR